MSVYQVGEFYIYTNNKDIDFSAAKSLCEEYGCDFNQDGDTATIETFYSEGEAIEFEELLSSKAAI